MKLLPSILAGLAAAYSNRLRSYKRNLRTIDTDRFEDGNDYAPVRRGSPRGPARKMTKWDQDWQAKIDQRNYNNDKVDMEELLNFVESLE